MRNWGIDDPERDAEEYFSREDNRPLVGNCLICDTPLHGSCEGWDADDGYEVEEGYVCDECLREYMKDKRIR